VRGGGTPPRRHPRVAQRASARASRSGSEHQPRAV